MISRPLVAAIALALTPVTPAVAQTMSPAWDPVMAGQGMVLRDMNKAQTRRQLNRNGHDAASGDGLGASARATCRDKANFAARFGAGDARVQRLYALCARAGY